MKRFRFPLRPVAVLRAHREVRAKEEFAVAVSAYVNAEQLLAQARARSAELARIMAASRQESFRAADSAAFFQAYRRECDQELKAERDVNTARSTMEQRRSAYVEAHKQLKTVTKLEERAREVHRLENDRAEQAALDEFAAYRAARRPALS